MKKKLLLFMLLILPTFVNADMGAPTTPEYYVIPKENVTCSFLYENDTKTVQLEAGKEYKVLWYYEDEIDDKKASLSIEYNFEDYSSCFVKELDKLSYSRQAGEIELASTSDSIINGKVLVNNGVNMYEQPNKSSKLITNIPYNTPLTLYRLESSTEDASGWARVTYNGATGYIYNANCEIIYSRNYIYDFITYDKIVLNNILDKNDTYSLESNKEYTLYTYDSSQWCPMKGTILKFNDRYYSLSIYENILSKGEPEKITLKTSTVLYEKGYDYNVDYNSKPSCYENHCVNIPAGTILYTEYTYNEYGDYYALVEYDNKVGYIFIKNGDYEYEKPSGNYTLPKFNDENIPSQPIAIDDITTSSDSDKVLKEIKKNLNKTKSNNLILYCSIAAGVLVISAIVVIILINKKKKKKNEEIQDTINDKDASIENNDSLVNADTDENNVNYLNQESIDNIPESDSNDSNK